MAHQESAQFGKGDFVLLDEISEDAFMANLKMRWVYQVNLSHLYFHAAVAWELASATKSTSGRSATAAGQAWWGLKEHHQIRHLLMSHITVPASNFNWCFIKLYQVFIWYNQTLHGKRMKFKNWWYHTILLQEKMIMVLTYNIYFQVDPYPGMSWRGWGGGSWCSVFLNVS